jgi:hypothetical protein
MKKKGHRHTKAGKSTITRRPSQWPRTLRRTTWLARHPAPQNTTSCFVEHTEDWRPCWLSSGVFLSPEEESELLLKTNRVSEERLACALRSALVVETSMQSSRIQRRIRSGIPVINFHWDRTVGWTLKMRTLWFRATASWSIMNESNAHVRPMNVRLSAAL